MHNSELQKDISWTHNNAKVYFSVVQENKDNYLVSSSAYSVVSTSENTVS